MIFWIVLGVAVAITVFVFIYQYLEWDEFGIASLAAFLAAFLSAAGGAMVLMILCIWFGPTAQFQGEDDHDLVALQTSSSVEGRSYFLGAGYINGKRTLNYITADDGAYRIESADADDSVIYQDSADPTVTVHEWDVVNPWFAPWSFGHSHTYTFHVPEGSILSDYTIDNE